LIKPPSTIIDLSNSHSSSHRAQIIDQVKEAASAWSFFQVINHGISQKTTIESTIKSLKSLHEQSHEVKYKYYAMIGYVVL
jgi:isopenicillin N synthase-like dioxygenase